MYLFHHHAAHLNSCKPDPEPCSWTLSMLLTRSHPMAAAHSYSSKLAAVKLHYAVVPSSWGAPRQRYTVNSLKEPGFMPDATSLQTSQQRSWLPKLPSVLMAPFKAGTGSGASSLQVSTCSDFHALHLSLTAHWAEHMALTEILSVLSRAVQLASNTHVEGPTYTERLLCKAVITLCCLALLDKGLDRLEPRTVAGILNALGLLVAYDLLPEARRGAPRELLIVAQQLTQRARLASMSGSLGPNQLAGALRGAVLLSPHFVNPDWLQAVQSQLSSPAVISRLAPESVAALLGSITHVRQGRLRRWQPDEGWVLALQQDVIPRLADFNGFELATTVYGFADLTAPSNPLAPPPAVMSTQAPSNSQLDGSTGANTSSDGGTAGAAGSSAASQSHEEQKAAMKQAALYRRVAEMQAATGRTPIPATMQQLQPSLIAQVQAWEKVCWSSSSRDSSSPCPDAAAVPQATSTSTSGIAPAAAAAAPSAGAVAKPVVAPLMKDVQAYEEGLKQAQSAGSNGTARAGSPVINISSSPAPSGDSDAAVHALCPRDLALLLVSYSRFSAPGFQPAPPGRPALEVLWAQQSKLDVDMSSAEEDEEE